MNLHLLPLGWVHLLASLAAIAAGIVLLLRPKGTPTHRQSGRFYAATVLLVSATALGIYRRGVFFFPHWLAIAAIIVTTVGLFAVHFKIPRQSWLHLHLTSMVTSFYILIGGGVNEMFLRVDALHRLAPNFQSPVVGLVHLALITLFLTLGGYLNLRVRREAEAAARSLAGACRGLCRRRGRVGRPALKPGHSSPCFLRRAPI